MYTDDTEIYASSKHCDELVANLNCDIDNVRKWMLQNKLQIHPTKTKYMYIGSPYNIKNKTSSNSILIKNTPVPRTETYTCLGVNLDERLTWEKHINEICAKVGAHHHRAARVITRSTYDTRSVDVLNTLGWETLDQKPNCMYKLINSHAAPNLKQSFRLQREGDTFNVYHNL
jgi:hypothetical protein